MRRVVPFRASHMPAITERPDLRAAAPALEQAGGAWTLMGGEGGPIAAGGLAQLWPGVAEAWVAIRPGLSMADRVAVARTARRVARVEADGRGFWRVQASAVAQRVPDCRLAEVIGMAAEGVMRRFGKDGADHVRFAWVRP